MADRWMPRLLFPLFVLTLAFTGWLVYDTTQYERSFVSLGDRRIESYFDATGRLMYKVYCEPPLILDSSTCNLGGKNTVSVRYSDRFDLFRVDNWYEFKGQRGSVKKVEKKESEKKEVEKKAPGEGLLEF